MLDADDGLSPRIGKPVRKGEMIADAIADEILQRNLASGTRLPNEAQLAERYGAGRATVREALRLLEADGLVEVRPGLGGGPVVSEPDMERVGRRLSILLRLSGSTFWAVAAARKVLEPALAFYAAKSATEEQLQAMEASVERLEQAQDEGGQAFIAENARFHSLIAESSGNPALLTFWFAIRAIIDGQELGIRYGADERRAVVKAHRRVYKAIAARDPEKARLEMERHVAAIDDHLAKNHPELIDEKIAVAANRR